MFTYLLCISKAIFKIKCHFQEEESNDEEWNGDSKLENSADVDDDIDSSDEEEGKPSSKGKADSSQDPSNGALPGSEGNTFSVINYK
jgi:hypothetical protein